MQTSPKGNLKTPFPAVKFANQSQLGSSTKNHPGSNSGLLQPPSPPDSDRRSNRAKSIDDSLNKYRCALCARPTLLLCSQCQDTYYCCEDHQFKDRPRHQNQCKQTAFARNLIDLTGVSAASIFEYKKLYVTRNRARRSAIKELFSEQPEAGFPFLMKSKLISRELVKLEPTVQVFMLDLILDLLLEIRFYFMMSRLEEARYKLLELYNDQILKLNLTENSRWTNEHKILFLVRHEFPFNDLAERKDLVLIDMDAMKAIFMEDPEVESYLNIMNDPLFATRKDPQTVVTYYKKVIKLKGMCLGAVGNFFDNLAMFDEAETCYMKYIELLENNFGLENAVVSNGYFTLGTFYFKRGLLQKPLMCFQKAREIRVKKLGEEHASVIDCDVNSLIVLSEMRQIDNAILLFKKVEKLAVKTEGNLSLKLARAYFVVSAIYSQMENDELALNYLDKAKFITNKVGESAANAYGAAQLRQEEDLLFDEFDKQTFGKYFENFKESFSMFEMLKGTTLMK